LFSSPFTFWTLFWATDCFICHESTRHWHWHCYLTTRRLGFIALFVRMSRIYGDTISRLYCIAHGVSLGCYYGNGKRSSVMTLLYLVQILLYFFINNSSNRNVSLPYPSPHPCIRPVNHVDLEPRADPSEHELSTWIFPFCPRIPETDLQQAHYVALYRSARPQPNIRGLLKSRARHLPRKFNALF
jgi:hypothetical protein